MATDVCYLEDSKLFNRVGARADTHLYSRKMYPSGVFPYTRGVEFLLRAADTLFRRVRIDDALEQLLVMARQDSEAVYAYKTELDAVELSDQQKLSEELTDTLRIFGFQTFAEDFLSEFAKRCGGSTVIERTAEHIRYLPLIHAVFPDAQIVLTRRDKRQCIASYFKTYGRGTGWRRYVPQRVKEYVLWRQMIQDEGRERWAVEQPWVTSLDYTEVMDNPIQQIGQLADELGLKIDREKFRSYLSGNLG